MTNNEFTYVDDETLGMIIRTNDDGTLSYIPKDESNADYQAYSVWKAEQDVMIEQQDTGVPYGG